jgi:hypothetical protein
LSVVFATFPISIIRVNRYGYVGDPISRADGGIVVTGSVANVIIVLPGLGGSRLYDNDQEIWPGGVSDLFEYPESKLEILINNPLIARDIVRAINGIPIYQTLIGFLDAHGYQEQPRDGPPSLVVFPYDWRQDLVMTAGKLADCIVQIHAAYHGSCIIRLLAHSTGGLIARCLLESGEFDDRLGAARRAVSDLITMGTAGKGAPEALGGVVGLEGLLFLKPDQAARLAAAPGFPAAYQHLPAPGTTALWDLGTALLPRDIYATDVAQKLDLKDSHLARAIDFWSKLAFPLRPSTSPRYFAFVGTRQTTLTGYYYDGEKTGAAALRPQETEDGGDGTIPIWSAGQPELEVQYVGGSHPILFNDAELQARLLELIPPGPTAAIKLDDFKQRASGEIDVSIRHLVPRISGPTDGRSAQMIVGVRIGAATAAEGRIVIEWKRRPKADAVDQAAWEAQKFERLKEIPISLPEPPPFRQNVPIGKVTDFLAGQYRACFLRKDEEKPAGHCAHFIIQGDPEGTGASKGLDSEQY